MTMDHEPSGRLRLLGESKTMKLVASLVVGSACAALALAAGCGDDFSTGLSAGFGAVVATGDTPGAGAGL